MVKEQVQLDQAAQAAQEVKTIHGNNNSNWEMLHVNHQMLVDLLMNLELE